MAKARCPASGGVWRGSVRRKINLNHRPSTLFPQTHRRRGMGKVAKASSENAAAFLWRYKMALYRSMEEMELPNHRWLAEEIERGACMFGDVTIDAGARPPITQDRKHPDFFRAVVLLDDTAMP